MKTVYSFDNQGNIFSLIVPTLQHSQRYKDHFEMIKDFQGVYETKEQVRQYLDELMKVNQSYGLSK